MLNRRQFVVAAAASVACLHCPSRLLLGAEQASAPIDCGPLSKFSAEGICADFVRGNRFFLVTQGGKLFAPTARCPHEGKALVHDDAAKSIECTEHKQSFELDGSVRSGKRVKNGLARLSISLNDQQHVVVEPGRRFSQSQWADAASFITIPAK